MVELGVVGSEQFLLGFRLAGIKQTFNAEEDPEKTIEEAMNTEDIGVLVVEEEAISSLPGHRRRELSESVNPVVVQLSKDGGSGDMRQKIVRAIGVDLWKDDD